jgi:hypothetical protein
MCLLLRDVEPILRLLPPFSGAPPLDKKSTDELKISEE